MPSKGKKRKENSQIILVRKETCHAMIMRLWKLIHTCQYTDGDSSVTYNIVHCICALLHLALYT